MDICLVKDTRDNTFLFGEVILPNGEEETMLRCDKTDLIQVGGGPMQQVLPVSAVRVYPGINSIEAAKAFAGAAVLDCGVVSGG